ncbi:FAD-dependent oxidoreductase [Paenibacillus sp. CC-CFT747]|nr:FAD-dependent oxidoreductase [Paenibacillus sp. CC-CFT747]
MRRAWITLVATFIVLLAVGGSYLYYKEKYGGGISVSEGVAQPLTKVDTVAKPKDSYDVIVVGTDPEGVAAAVSAARNGLHTLLIDGKNRDILGGLMTLGWLNMIDNNYDSDKPSALPGQRRAVYNNGIFKEWYDMVEGTSFDINTGANAFHTLVRNEKNIDVSLKNKAIEPLMKDGTEGTKLLEGIQVTLENGSKQTIRAKEVIDATQDADLAAAAGVPYTVGREDLKRPDDRMAVTVVFRLKNADNAFWKQVRIRLDNDNNSETGADEHSAWGFGEMQKYPPTHDQIKMRGLNVGRQNDDTILINAMQIFGIDPLDPASRAKAFKLAENELPHILAYMKKLYPEFANLELGGMAPELYVRETRHIKGLYRLSIIDVLENRDFPDRIAFGSYRVDLQRISPQDNGLEILAPYKYAVPFRSIVPQAVDGLLVVGRSASFDSLAHGSARVIPVGMATAQAAGAAAKIAIDQGVTFRQMADKKDLISQLQDNLNKQGMDLKPFSADGKPGTEYMKHKAYPGLKAAVYLGMVGSVHDKVANDFKLDDPANPQGFVNLLLTAKRVFSPVLKGDPSQALKQVTGEPAKQPLTYKQAVYTAALLAGIQTTPEEAEQKAVSMRVVTDKTVSLITDKQKLTKGETYLILKDVLEAMANVRF